ncbi:MAG: branched-chain amino acid ABC transporter permease [Candidatus Hodarchaeota archaeon]
MSKIKEKLEGFPKYLKDWASSFKGALTLVCLIGLFTFPILTQNAYFLGIFVLAMIFAIFAASWDFLAGFAGQVSFGHAIFFGTSAYTFSATLMFNDFPWWASLIVGTLVSVGIGFLIGIVCLRLKGPYLALGTMVIGIMLMSLFRIPQFKDFLWGEEGISGIPPLSNNYVIFYFTILIFMCLSMIIMIQITKSKMGTIFKSIRDDETGSRASGINVTKYKVFAFMISSLFAGLAGCLFAMYNRSVNPQIFQPYYSFIVLIMAALGGIASISGSALGAFTFIFLSEILRDLDQLAPIPILGAFFDPRFVFSILLILIIRFVSQGILRPALERLKDLWDLLLGR